jgi:predicted kinase
MLPRLVIVTGAPGTGKTILATRLSHELGLPLLTKDTIKEAMMDALPVADREASMQLGAAAFRLLFTLSQSLLDAGIGIVLEGPFTHPQADAPLRELGRNARVTLIHCVAPAELVVKRYRERYESGQRHPGHFDSVVLDGLAARLRAGAYDPPLLDGPKLIVDSSDGYDPTLDEIVAALKPDWTVYLK